MVETVSGTREDRWWPSMELSYSAFDVIGMTFNSSASSPSLDRRTWVGEYLSSWCRCRYERENLVVEVPSERVATSRKGRPKDPHGK